MGFLGLFNAYAMRACLSITITRMVVQPVHTINSTDDSCSFPADELPHGTSTALIEDRGGTYDWDELTQVIMTSNFNFLGYTKNFSSMFSDILVPVLVRSVKDSDNGRSVEYSSLNLNNHALI